MGEFARMARGKRAMGFMSNIGEAVDRMRRMMGKTGVDLSQLPGEDIAATMRKAGTACCCCKATAECDSFLETTPEHVNAPDFCPNSQRFAPFVSGKAE
jgi:hypothetical protein